MPRFLAAEVKARVRELYEGMPLTHARIAAATGVGASTVSVLAQREGWTRHPEARVAARLEAGRREAILRLREAGVPARAVAAAAGCHPRTVGRVAPPERRAAAFATGAAAEAEAGFAPAPAPIPEHLAELHAALTKPGLRRGEAVALLMRCATALGAEALARQDLAVERTGQVLARLAARVATLPEHDPAGAGPPDSLWRPATFEETNALLEELARRFNAFVAEEDAGAADGARQDGGGPVRNAHIL